MADHQHGVRGPPWVFHSFLWVCDSKMGASTPTLSYNSPPMTSRMPFIRLGHATDQKRHLGLIPLRIFKMRWVSFANDHLGPKPLISDSATRRSL